MQQSYIFHHDELDVAAVEDWSAASKNCGVDYIGSSVTHNLNLGWVRKAEEADDVTTELLTICSGTPSSSISMG